jgi:F-type H+-transporting ATPase subunit c
MEIAGMTKIAAAIAVLPLFGVGIALGNLFSTLISSIARNPSVKDELFSRGILAFALTESIALFALIVSLLILFG